jgi:hypothetical protein
VFVISTVYNEIASEPTIIVVPVLDDETDTGFGIYLGEGGQRPVSLRACGRRGWLIIVDASRAIMLVEILANSRNIEARQRNQCGSGARLVTARHRRTAGTRSTRVRRRPQRRRRHSAARQCSSARRWAAAPRSSTSTSTYAGRISRQSRVVLAVERLDRKGSAKNGPTDVGCDALVPVVDTPFGRCSVAGCGVVTAKLICLDGAIAATLVQQGLLAEREPQD